MMRNPTRFFALKDADTFVVTDALGDITGSGDGLFLEDTRLLSRLQLKFGDDSPSLLSASVSRDNVLFTANLTNRPLPELGGRSLPQGIIHLERVRFVWQHQMHERIRCVNFSGYQASVPLTVNFAADFLDMFEVRGMDRAARGKLLPVRVGTDRVVFEYQGLDGVRTSSTLAFDTLPLELNGDHAVFTLSLPPSGSAEVHLEAGPDSTVQPGRERFRRQAAHARFAMRGRSRRGARLRSSGRLFNEWIERSRADLALLTSDLSTGPYPYAGIPWFSVPFGRDAIITALQMLWLDPALACGVLRFLARNQAHEVSPFQDAAPGKIMHETRKGEMTRLSELPFGKYYGGVDTTPLFVMLAGAYANRTGDMALIDELWPALLAACSWIESVADASPDGFLTYARAAETGLANQCWKDSEDSVFHADGSFPDGPVALVEVQGYVYAAFNTMAALAGRRGIETDAARWRERAETLRRAVEERFWMEDRGFYGLAIDGHGALCRVAGSNAGHLLYVGLPSGERGASVARQLLSNHFDSGWGVRTLARGQARFNPMSYHNGSVWPHDSALCAAGMASYRERSGTMHLLNQMFEAAVSFGMQLPELFCGFPRAAGELPVSYPVACLPQAWAAGSIFMLLQSCIGLRIDGWTGTMHIDRPMLPVGIDRLSILHLPVRDGLVELTIQRIGKRVVASTDGTAECVPVIVRV